ncbi:unnamed protein product [Darwinula stevensoni]|uniref:Uncharacterized protein n=1 Tax=Darwinula stevensoni TaxID=69355 RepID=A0A7R9A7D3_9CRUS|nr:unnamed protein product [Darwinula stevensoni]CAG0892817.1 unnamed protein product [Darwinula stevensoni]
MTVNIEKGVPNYFQTAKRQENDQYSLGIKETSMNLEVKNKQSSLHVTCNNTLRDKGSYSSAADDPTKGAAACPHLDAYQHDKACPTRTAKKTAPNPDDDPLSTAAKHVKVKDGEQGEYFQHEWKDGRHLIILLLSELHLFMFFFH